MHAAARLVVILLGVVSSAWAIERVPPPGHPIDVELASPEAHVFDVELTAGQFFAIRFSATGATVQATLTGPNGSPLDERSVSSKRSMRLAAIAAEAGIHHLSFKTRRTARFTFTVDALRPATAQDAKRIEAQQSLDKAVRSRARSECDASVQLWRESADAEGVRESLLRCGEIHSAGADYKTARALYDEALTLCQTDRRCQAMAIHARAQNAQASGDPAEAIEDFRRAFALHQELGDRVEEGIVLHNLGTAHWLSGEPQEALAAYRQALALRETQNDSFGIALTRLGIALSYSSMGEPQSAIDEYREVIRGWQSLKNPQGEANARNGLGLVYLAVGQPDRAREEQSAALALWHSMDSKIGEGYSLSNLGMVDAYRRDLRSAESLYKRALALLELAKDRRGLAYVEQNLGSLLAEQGKHAEAVEHFRKSLADKQALHDQFGEADALHHLGLSLHATRDQSARSTLEQALTLRIAVNDRLGTALTRGALARLDFDGGKLEQARSQVETALHDIEAVRMSLVTLDLRTSYFSQHRELYSLLIDILARTDPAAALEIAERARARSLLDALGEAQADVREGADPELLRRERELQRQINAQAERLSRQSQAADANRRLTKLLAAFEENQTAIREKSPRYAALTQPSPLGLAAIRHEVLDKNTLLLEYWLGERQSGLWVVSESSLRFFALPARRVIEPMARHLYQAVTERNRVVAEEPLEARRARLSAAKAEFQKQAAALSRVLLGPATPMLGSKRLLIVADGILQYLPFSALSDPAAPARLLIASHEVVPEPSASSLGLLRRDHSSAGHSIGKWTVGIVADPVYRTDDDRVPKPSPAAAPSFARLRNSRLEATKLAAHAGPRAVQMLDFDANRATITGKDFTSRDLLHFATHTVIDNQQPALSAIVLSLSNKNGRTEDGFLRLNEIYNLPLDAELVVLSACKTTGGMDVAGEGLIGLTRGFFYAGARRVISTKWSIEDDATAVLMDRFYRALFQSRLSPAAALRTAQLEMQRDARWSDPYFWAAFDLQGEWR